jgi:hypothetical protein
MKQIVLSEDVRLPKSTIILEKGDVISVLSEEEWEDYDLVPEDDFFPEDDFELDISNIEIESDEVILPDEEVIVPEEFLDSVNVDLDIPSEEEIQYLAGEYPENGFV